MLSRKPAWLKFPCLADYCLKLCAFRAALAVLTPVWEPQQGTDPEMEAHFWVGGSVSTEVCGVACAAFIISYIFPFFLFKFFFVF